MRSRENGLYGPTAFDVGHMLADAYPALTGAKGVLDQALDMLMDEIAESPRTEALSRIHDNIATVRAVIGYTQARMEWRYHDLRLEQPACDWLVGDDEPDMRDRVAVAAQNDALSA